MNSISTVEIEYNKPYSWVDFYEILHPIIKVGNSCVVRGFNPPDHMRFAVRERINDVDSVVFFKTESDMIAFDNRDCHYLKDKRLLARGKYLDGIINDRN